MLQVVPNKGTTKFKNELPEKAIGKPFLKWAGGKTALLSKIFPFLPKYFNSYYEPFIGGGALFFATNPYNSVISDINGELINVYVQVRDNCEAIICALKQMPYDEDFYYETRKKKPTNLIDRAIRMIYLNRTCWNGLYRENLKGEFNVPFGKFKNAIICDEVAIRNASTMLKKAKIMNSDFQDALVNVQEGDLVFIDPPYTVINESDRFTKYNSKIFSWEDQIRLAKTAKELTERGAYIVVSNAHHKEIKKLYQDFNSHVIKRTSLISGDKKGRRKTTEYLFTNISL
ncbi:DNA adenine methylase [Shimazuella alba]|uniref:Site-specific DNA-methyltransferase (adenine-specific) n=1 Tax=Shimazuella alba TaxID=2690964 RepID=A0A6I4VWI5_9BACL|nr:DNA adenine methylase [Shimazuella alba]MXQ54968.1 Dam family site-specific DNA-(adenine-N6)-methyltransferase [Shimazuella alba]